MREPRDGVGLAAPGRVLDQVAPARAVLASVGQELANHIELVEARPDLGRLLLAGLLVLGLDDLGVVLEDVGQAIARQDALPQVVGHEAVRVRRVPRAVIPALIEGQEPRGLPLQVRTEAHRLIVHREVRHAAAELEELLARIAVQHVLLDGVGDGLLGETVLQLERGHRQAVDEQPHVERTLRLVAAVAKLPRHAESVGGVALGSRRVARRWSAVEEIEMERSVLDAVAQDVDGAALHDLALQPRQELAPRRAVLAERQRLGGVRLRLGQERPELRQVHAVLAVVVLGLPADPAGAVDRRPLVHRPRHRARIAGRPGQRRADQPLEAALGGVGGHGPGSAPSGSAGWNSRTA